MGRERPGEIHADGRACRLIHNSLTKSALSEMVRMCGSMSVKNRFLSALCVMALAPASAFGADDAAGSVYDAFEGAEEIDLALALPIEHFSVASAERELRCALERLTAVF